MISEAPFAGLAAINLRSTAIRRAPLAIELLSQGNR
jgi:hypothetical protein